MIVHLLRAPYYREEDFNAVVTLLDSFEMPGWIFKRIEPFQFPEEVLFDFLSSHNNDGKPAVNEVKIPVPCHVFFDLCKHYRQKTDTPANELVVILATQSNDLNWFSMFDKGHNIFINTSDWEPYFANCHHKYPVAHEIIANCLQQAMHLNTDQMYLEECIHMKTRGCMNDFCGHKPDIAMKMRTADICQICMKRLESCGVQRPIFEAASKAFEKLRLKMRYLEGFDWKSWKGAIKVNDYWQIIFPELDDMEISMTPLMKTLYLFYLVRRKNNLPGVPRAELYNNREELFCIYILVSGHERRANIIVNGILHLKEMLQSIDDLAHVHQNSFSEKKSRIKDVFIKNIGEDLAHPYLIKEVADAGVLSIELTPEKICIKPKINLISPLLPLPIFPYKMSKEEKNSLRIINNS